MLNATASNATATAPAAALGYARASTAAYTAPSSLVAMAPSAVGNLGGSQAHLNMQPFLTISFCIALQGIFPSRN